MLPLSAKLCHSLSITSQCYVVQKKVGNTYSDNSTSFGEIVDQQTRDCKPSVWKTSWRSMGAKIVSESFVLYWCLFTVYSQISVTYTMRMICFQQAVQFWGKSLNYEAVLHRKTIIVQYLPLIYDFLRNCQSQNNSTSIHNRKKYFFHLVFLG